MTRMHPSRRAFLGGVLGAAATLGSARHVQARATRPRPHYVVVIQLLGGVDSVLTVDPKDAAAVGDRIDVGYRSAERLLGKRRFYGPTFAPLMRHESDLCLVHGVRCDTVAHGDGTEMLARGRSTYSTSTPHFGDVLGPLLSGGAPIEALAIEPTVAFGTFSPRVEPPSVAFIPRGAAAPLIAGAGKARSSFGADARALIDAAFEGQAERIFDPSARARDVNRMRLAARLSRFLDSIEPHNRFSDPSVGPSLELALQAIQGNHARLLLVASHNLWVDSHTDNLRVQNTRTTSLLNDVATFLDLLKKERNEFGPLFEQTTVAIGSELGRFPKLNAMNGKDHWPENSWILCGRGIRREDGGVTIGATGPDFRGLPVDFNTGRTDEGARRPIFLDSIFATLIRAAGEDPRRHGYDRDVDLARALI